MKNMMMTIADIDPEKNYILFGKGRFLISTGETFIKIMQYTHTETLSLYEYGDDDDDD